ncbi:type VII secretion target [Glycomyces harbinensis]|uniref:Excreted virulence factor EspC, type VII ESX diderm n=1 Tax=Glycomyces harbinensis TaxID=58114 RepID=A0A1G6Y2Z8_9ACTN|nr:type VII secretion target [Glycomyces harbinensis]SDD84759.1 Excreted virulence factor EspC, type VII ESX diderm [Glycomyces harbinensis]
MARVFDTAFVRQLGAGIDANVVPILESTNEILPELSAVDRGLYTTVTLPMAAAYTMAASTVTESMAGAAECFREMREALDACAQDMEDTDDACAQSFGGK